jgi:16S rRNA (cytosine1402-N4)-methyltransferase
MTHASVLLQESIEGLDIRAGDVFLDCTLGGGGHSLEVCKRFGKSVKMVGLDADSVAIARSAKRLTECGCEIDAVCANFRNLDSALDGLGIGNVDKILMDLGLSSNQFEESARGFSFKKDEPHPDGSRGESLLMTFEADPAEGMLTAQTIVNLWDEENIATVIRAYGDERYAKRIARAIAEERKIHEIRTTSDLVRVILSATPARYHHGKIHPATRTFQALRMTVNDELGALTEGLSKAFERLSAGGRIAVISFHSGEDRIVKNFFREEAKGGRATALTKKPIVPSEEEVKANPRARSAKLRIAEKL